MTRGFAKAGTRGSARRRLLFAGAGSLMLSCLLLAAGASAMGQPGGVAAGPSAAPSGGSTATAGQPGRPGGATPGSSSATLLQCPSAASGAERSATFAGEMTALPGSVRMAMQIEIQVQPSVGEPFHTVNAPGLGTWRVSDPGVKNYKFVRQVTNLAPAASYRALVRFHWLNAHNRLIKVAQRRTPRCAQPA